jgi:predicted RNase H-like HicB family nuclease
VHKSPPDEISLVSCYDEIGRIEIMELNITIELWQKGNWYLARSPELDFIAQGRTVEEAKGNLFEVIKIQFTEMEEMGTLKDYLTECGFEIKDGTIAPLNGIIGFERLSLKVA